METIGLIPQFGSLIWTIAAFVVALSVIVAIHEYGHYIVGRWSGIHADVFSLGFGPVLYSRFDKRGTKWQVAALPFGGYVKFKGDANAASGKDEEAMAAPMSAEELRSTMHGAPLWARTATVAAGPVFNFIFSLIVFTGVFMWMGKPTEDLQVGDIRPVPYAEQQLQPGDQITAIEGLSVTDEGADNSLGLIGDRLPVQETLTYSIVRGGQDMNVQAPHLLPPMVREVLPGSAAYDASLKGGDVITGINGTDVFTFSELKTAVEGSNGAPLNLKVWREGDTIDLVLTPKRVDEPLEDGGFATQWRIGIAGGLLFEHATGPIGVGEAVSDAGARVLNIMGNSLSALYHMVAGNISTCNMSGPIGIAQASGGMASQGADNFIIFIALLSTAVGLLNLFPIPALDGGHLVFYAYEAVTGKPPSDGALRVMMTFGLVLILSLMVFALGNDLFCP